MGTLTIQKMTAPFKEWLKGNGIEDTFSEQSWNNLVLFALFSEFVMETQAAIAKKLNNSAN